VLAQEDVPDLPTECTAESMTELVAALQERVGTALPAIESGDLVGAMDALQQVQNRLQVMRALCDALVFQGSANMVLGPVTFPAGVYRARVITDGYFIASVNPLEGECGAGTSFFTPGLFILSEGEANAGAEAIFTSLECTALIEVSNVRQSWKLEFERITTG